MFTAIQRWLTPPVYTKDEEKTRKSAILYSILQVFFLLILADVVPILFIYREKLASSFTLAAFLISNLLSMILTRLGRVRTASLITIISMWAGFSLLVVLGGGLTSIAPVYFVAGTVVTGLLVGPVGAVLFGLACLLEGGLLPVLTGLGYVIPRLFPIPPLTALVDLIGAITVSVVAISIAETSMNRALAQSRLELSERRAAEQALKESEERYRTLFDSASEAILLINESDQRIIQANPAACLLYGYSMEELSRLALSDLEIGRLAADVPGRVPSAAGSTFHRRKAGPPVAVELTQNTFTLNGQKQAVCFIRDVTERSLAEEQIRQLNLDLENRVTQRTAELVSATQELESFSYTISHTLRAPLRSLNGYSAILAEELRDRLGETGQMYLEQIKKSTLEMGDLIDSLLNLTFLGRHPLHRSAVDLSALVGAVIDNLRRRDRAREVAVTIQPGQVAEADEVLVRTVLENILENAWKFTSWVEHAQITFGSLAAAGGPAVHYVRDNGAGFDNAYSGKLFGAFLKLHRSEDYPGSGTGLASVSRIIQRHGGKIWAEGAPGQGAVFYFTLSESTTSDIINVTVG